MKGMIAIIRKEFARFFLDRRMLITTILMPGLLIYLVYTLMGHVCIRHSGRQRAVYCGGR